ncbi:hypothetical protein AAG906_008576 [Vitis piasezkii]
MSGGVGPTYNDIQLPKDDHDHDDQDHHQQPISAAAAKNVHHPTMAPTSNRFLTFRQLNALAVIVVFSASGMVSIEDFVFVVFSYIYIHFISKVAFPPPPNASTQERVFDPNNKFLSLYVFIAAIIGLILPIAYIFHGILEEDKQGIKAASPHVFLLSSQVFMEGVAFSDKFSIPISVFVPVFYNSRRIFTIVEWLRNEIGKVDEEYGGSAGRVYIGRALAIANMVLWCFNLFGFLLPVYLPRAFKKYYASFNKIKD